MSTSKKQEQVKVNEDGESRDFNLCKPLNAAHLLAMRRFGAQELQTKMVLRRRQHLANSNYNDKAKLFVCKSPEHQQRCCETNKSTCATNNISFFSDSYVANIESTTNKNNSIRHQANYPRQQVSNQIFFITTQLSSILLTMSIVTLISICSLCLASQAMLHVSAQFSSSNSKVNSRQDSNIQPQQQQQSHIGRPSPPGLQVARTNHLQAYDVIEPLSSVMNRDIQAGSTAPGAKRSIDRFDSGQEHQIISPILKQPTTLPPLSASSSNGVKRQQVSIGEGTNLQAAASQDSSYLSPEEREQLFRSQESHYEGKSLDQQPTDGLSPMSSPSSPTVYQRPSQLANANRRQLMDAGSNSELTDLGGSSSNNPESQLNRPPASEAQSSNEVDESDYEDDNSEPANEPTPIVPPASRSSESIAANQRRHAAATANRQVLQEQQQKQQQQQAGVSPDSSSTSGDDDDSSDDYNSPSSDDAYFNRKSLQDRQQAEQLVAAKTSNRATNNNNNNNDYNPQDEGSDSMKRPDSSGDDIGSLDGSDSGNGGDDDSNTNTGDRFDRRLMSGGGGDEPQAQPSGSPPYVAPINRNAQKSHHPPKAPLASNSALHGSSDDSDSAEDSNDSEDDSNVNGSEESQPLSGSSSNNNNMISRLTPTPQQQSSSIPNQSPPIYNSPHLKVVVKTVQQPIQRIGLTIGHQALPKTIVYRQQVNNQKQQGGSPQNAILFSSLNDNKHYQQKSPQPMATASVDAPYNPQNNPSHVGKYFIN